MTDDKFSDIALFQGLVAGRMQAMEVLYKRYFLLMLNYGLKYSADRDQVKDSIHDIFVHCFSNSKIRLSSIVSVRSYLLKSLRNSIFDKRAKTARIPFIDEMSFVSPPDSEDLFEKIFPQDDLQTRNARIIVESLAELSPNAQTALYLRFVKDFSHKEIADILGISEQGSMNLVSKTIREIRKQLG